MLREKLRNRKGFTLIEIIVVIVILAVLMAVAVPSVMSYMNEGNKAKYETVARAAMINTQTAVAKDYGDNGKIDNITDVVEWINGTAGDSVDQYFGSKKSYGSNVTVNTTDITLNSAKDDVSSAKYVICLDSTAKTKEYKEVSVTVNGKMTVADATGAGTKATTYTDYKG